MEETVGVWIRLLMLLSASLSLRSGAPSGTGILSSLTGVPSMVDRDGGKRCHCDGLPGYPLLFGVWAAAAPLHQQDHLLPPSSVLKTPNEQLQPCPQSGKPIGTPQSFPKLEVFPQHHQAAGGSVSRPHHPLELCQIPGQWQSIQPERALMSHFQILKRNTKEPP